MAIMIEAGVAGALSNPVADVPWAATLGWMIGVVPVVLVLISFCVIEDRQVSEVGSMPDCSKSLNIPLYCFEYLQTFARPAVIVESARRRRGPLRLELCFIPTHPTQGTCVFSTLSLIGLQTLCWQISRTIRHGICLEQK